MNKAVPDRPRDHVGLRRTSREPHVHCAQQAVGVDRQGVFNANHPNAGRITGSAQNGSLHSSAVHEEFLPVQLARIATARDWIGRGHTLPLTS